MSVTELLSQLGLDRYDIEARLKPALFAAVPAIAFTFLVWGAVPAVVLTTGAFCLVRPVKEFVRDRGLRVEQEAGSRVGNALTGRLLRHDDETLPVSVKSAVRDHVQSHYPVELPDRQEERAHPDRARLVYISAARALAAERRDDAARTLLFEENISYGFWRNLLGIRVPGLVISCSTCLLTLILVVQHVPNLQEGRGLGLALFSAVCAVLWWKLGIDRVETASMRYARRLIDNVAARATEDREPVNSVTS